VFWDTACFSIPIHPLKIKTSVWRRLQHPGSSSFVSENFVTNILPKISNVKLDLCLNPEPSIEEQHFPRITLKKRQGWWSVWIEGSMAKFFFKSNIFELTEENRVRLLLRLEYFLNKQGLFVTTSDIRHATIHKLDVSKILLVPPHIPLMKILEYLRKMDFDTRNETHYKTFSSLRNGGKGLCLSFGTKKHKFLSLYDKLEEVSSNSKKSSVEKDFLTFSEKQSGNMYQLLKYETSLFNKTKLDSTCNKLLGQKKDLYTFSDLWDRKLIRKILLYHGEQLFHSEYANMLLLGNGTQSEIQQALKTSFPKIRTSRLGNVAHWLGLTYELGLKDTKKQLKKDFSRATQYRILKDIRKILSKMEKLPMQDVFDNLYKQLKELRPIRSVDDLLLPKEQ